MNTNSAPARSAGRDAGAVMVDMRLEVVVLPVADPDRSKAFYEKLGWRLDADFAFDNGFRVVQLTPPGSGASIQFGSKLTAAAPGSAHGLYLIVSDIRPPATRSPTYGSFATFTDPDRNECLVQEVTERLPGRVDVNWERRC